MILVRNVFQLKMGKARDAIAVWKDGMAMFGRLGFPGKSLRLLTDLAGTPFYTLVFEATYETLTEFELAGKTMDSDEWRAWYARLSPLAEGGHREIFNIVA